MMYKVTTKTGYRTFENEIEAISFNETDGIGEVKEVNKEWDKEWDKEAYASEINQAHNDLFKSMYEERKYLSIGEIQMWEKKPKYVEESMALQNWWFDTCEFVEAYLEEVTQETAFQVEDFLKTLPELK